MDTQYIHPHTFASSLHKLHSQYTLPDISYNPIPQKTKAIFTIPQLRNKTLKQKYTLKRNHGRLHEIQEFCEYADQANNSTLDQTLCLPIHVKKLHINRSKTLHAYKQQIWNTCQRYFLMNEDWRSVTIVNHQGQPMRYMMQRKRVKKKGVRSGWVFNSKFDIDKKE